MVTSNTRRRMQRSSHNALSPLSLVLLSFLTGETTAQVRFDDVPSTTSSSVSFGGPTSTSSHSATASSTGVPAPTGYGAPLSNQQQNSNNGILNYYFLLLAIFIVVIAVAYCVLVRRRKRKIARSRNSGQNALAQDLEGWAGARRWGHNRWRSGGVHEPRAEEGLDERGEAPPPYMPGEPPPAHLDAPNSSNGYIAPIPLRTMERDAGKPPDYA